MSSCSIVFADGPALCKIVQKNPPKTPKGGLALLLDWKRAQPRPPLAPAPRPRRGQRARDRPGGAGAPGGVHAVGRLSCPPAPRGSV